MLKRAVIRMIPGFIGMVLGFICAEGFMWFKAGNHLLFPYIYIFGQWVKMPFFQWYT
jgi:hypothetical protein